MKLLQTIAIFLICKPVNRYTYNM